MIISNFTGNLGNHLFQYAITRVVAEKNGYEWGFNPTTEYDYYGGQSQVGFLDIDYGKQHNYKYKDQPEWIEHIWKEKHSIVTFSNGEQAGYYPFQPDIFDIEDNTRIYVDCCQDARYINDYKEKIRKWFHIRDDFQEIYRNQLLDLNIHLDENTTIVNVRGGEYRGVPSLILGREYYNDAFIIMKKRNPNAKFVCVTDDMSYANSLFYGAFPIIHLSIGGDYYVINNAKNLIISNSSFAIFPTWLNENNPYVIAPRYWAKHNISTGQWTGSDMWTFGWNYLDKDGTVYGK
jgi:hypothetical protein